MKITTLIVLCFSLTLPIVCSSEENEENREKVMYLEDVVQGKKTDKYSVTENPVNEEINQYILNLAGKNLDLIYLERYEDDLRYVWVTWDKYENEYLVQWTIESRVIGKGELKCTLALKLNNNGDLIAKGAKSGTANKCQQRTAKSVI